MFVIKLMDHINELETNLYEKCFSMKALFKSDSLFLLKDITFLFSLIIAKKTAT